MADLKLNIVERSVTKKTKTSVNGKLDTAKIDWKNLPYREMKTWVEKLVGERPELPTDIKASEWTSQAIRVLKERYFLKDKDGNVVETVEDMCWRVAWEMATAEIKYGKTKKEIEATARNYYEMMLSRNFLPNSPTLMNAGKNNGLQYSACYVIPVPDDLSGIFDGVKFQGLIHQSGGGTGFSFSRLRPAGSRVKSTMGVASGPVSFMRIYNEATQQIKQGGTRRGANMGILRVDHPDVMEFIHCKEDGGITNFNISVAITDKFMKALAKNEDYELINPHNGQVTGKISAKKVWDEISDGAWRTGDPGLIFIDRINKSSANPVRAEGWIVESTNPCGEQPLYPFDACNLGSIFLGYFVKSGDVDWDKLGKTSKMAVRFLDSVIEMNPFPLPQIADTVAKIRRIGLGVGGWADMLVALGIPYDSQKALDLAEKVMKFINEKGHEASQQLAAERGSFALWGESIYAKDKPIRNSTVTTIAPTGSIGILADASGGIEPLFAIAYQHIVKSENRTLTFVNPKFEEMARSEGFYSAELMDKVAQHGTIRELDEVPENVRNIFGTAHEIEPEWHVKMQAAFQKYTDNAVSKTINLRNETKVKDIQDAYMLAWETDCRGITVFRDGCKGEQVLNLGTKKEEKKADQVLSAQRVVIPRPVKVEGATYRIETPIGISFITVNHDSQGNPFEIFVTIGKAGSEVAAMAEALGRLISTTLRFGNHLPAKERAREIMEQLKGIGGGGSIGFGPNKIRSLPDAIAKALGMHFGLIGFQTEKVEDQVAAQQLQMEVKPQRRADLCPSCGNVSLVTEEGCKKCYGCGYSQC